MDKILIIYNKNESHQSIRLIMGLKACGLEHISVCDTPEQLSDRFNEKFDYIFVESSVNTNLKFLKDCTKNIIPYDVEDKPSWKLHNEGYKSILNYTKVYGKYNYQDQYPNEDGLKYIGLPQIDYINKGAIVAKNIFTTLYNIDTDYDVFFNGGPTYMTDYTPKEAPYINREELKTLVKKPINTGYSWESEWLYNQRLEWVDQIRRDDKLKVLSAALHFTNDPNRKHPLSIEYHSDLFGTDCYKYKAEFIDQKNYYINMMRTNIGLCPAGVARSSYRLIELMALGRIIISTDTENYKYLYNPKIIIEVPDGCNITEYIKAYKNNTSLKNDSIENVKVFIDLTPQKMWNDFKNQIK